MSGDRTSAHMPEYCPTRLARVRRRGAIFFRLFHRLDFVGCENIPGDGPIIVVSNHPTYLDPISVGLAFERHLYWMAWSDAFNWPYVGPLVKSLGAIPVNLEQPSADSYKASLAVLRAGAPLGIFFEGGRTNGRGINPPLPGAASLALRTGTPILPVSITGAVRCWPQTQLLPSPGKIVVVFHEPIPVEKTPRRDKSQELELTDHLARIVSSLLPPDGSPYLAHKRSERNAP